MTGLTRLEDAIPALRRYALALLRDRNEADDLVQDCLLRALDRIGSRTGEGDIRPWLFTILHNLCVSRWRRLKRRAAFMVDDPAADAVTPPNQALRSEVQAALRGLTSLPEEQRQVILLVAVEGFEYAEAAAILGIPVGTVMSRLSRGRNRLNDFMEGRQRPVLRMVQ